MQKFTYKLGNTQACTHTRTHAHAHAHTPTRTHTRAEIEGAVEMTHIIF